MLMLSAQGRLTRCTVGLGSFVPTQGIQPPEPLLREQNESDTHHYKRLRANVVIKNSVSSKHEFQVVRKQGAVSCVTLSWPRTALSWPQATPTLRKFYLSLDSPRLVFPSWGPGYGELSPHGGCVCVCGGVRVVLVEGACTPGRKAEGGVLSTTADLDQRPSLLCTDSVNNWRCLRSLSWHPSKPNAGRNVWDFFLSQVFNCTNSVWQYISANTLRPF